MRWPGNGLLNLNNMLHISYRSGTKLYVFIISLLLMLAPAAKVPAQVTTPHVVDKSVTGKVRPLYILLDSVRKERNDSIRIELNRQFYDEMVTALQLGFADSLKALKIGQPIAPDGKFIFYNWNIQQNDGSNLYAGIVYLAAVKKVIPLPIKTSESKLSADSVYASGNWPGALYYKIIGTKERKSKTYNYYVLLGWDRFSRQASRKTLEALTIKGDSALVFGRNAFKTKEGRAGRVIIEYSATANLTLNYSKQKLYLTGVRKSERTVNDSIIVVDRLAPLNESLEGVRWAYVPVGNIYDGYIFFNNYWTFVEGINPRNEADKQAKRRTKRPEMDLAPQRK